MPKRFLVFFFSLMMISVLWCSLEKEAYAKTKEIVITDNATILIKKGDKVKIKVAKSEKSPVVSFKSKDKKIVAVSGSIFTAKKTGKVVVQMLDKKKKVVDTISIRVEDEDFTYIAHRGLSAYYPQNTLRAFKEAYLHGADGVECDLYEAENGDLMVFHDMTLNAICGKNKVITKVNTTNRKKFPIVNASGVSKCTKAELIMPTIDEVLSQARSYGKKVYIHMKVKSEGVSYDFSEAGAKKLLKVIQKYKMEDDVVLISASSLYLSWFFDTGIELGKNTSAASRKELDECLDWCRENSFKGVSKLLIVNYSGLYNKEAGKSFCDACHDEGFEIGLYWVKNNSMYVTGKKYGVDFVQGNSIF